jgi:hypothetical protein
MVSMARVTLASAFACIAQSAAAEDTVSGRIIATVLSDRYTELEQETWWEENMAGRPHQITGRVEDVTKGTFSGYWVNLNVGSDIIVRCGLGGEHEEIARYLKKGQAFTCRGEPSDTWTAIFGIMFEMDFLE